ncbi:hypothetical protein BDY19DRAFT_201301 [Irpex rosettiformis]|uniref:Uncharacterized protein n=1 Tax=Irpex rosettiformis TaxID=378272 RepID=A0ACB8U142_9APHY|nr:hypothetical protein BDY19DRAFT_201301 [Irpex rosettiformis]
MLQLTHASAIFNATLSAAILYGTYAVLFLLAMFLLISKERTRININLMFITTLMFIVSSAHVALVIWDANIKYLDEDGARNTNVLRRRGDPMVYLPILFATINGRITDAIVFWRAWVVWGRTPKGLVIPSILWTASVVESIGVVHELATVAPGVTASLDATSVTNWSVAPGETAADSITSWTVALTATACFANFWAVCMMGKRYYVYHKEVVAILGRRQAQFRDLLVLLIETGILYCMLWLIFIILYMAGSQAMYIIIYSLVHLSGIYPTIIIVLVCLQATQQDKMEKFYTTIQFADSQTHTGNCRSSRENVLVEKNLNVAGGVVMDGMDSADRDPVDTMA